MRLDLLLQREPFGQILEKTLTHFWQVRDGQRHRVRWYKGRPDFAAIYESGKQLWLCNIYLNAIFCPQVDRAVLDPIRREFGRSVVPWQRPLQRMYISLATSHRGAPRLAHHWLTITPAVPAAHRKVILGGNHKLRLLDHRNRLAYGILKKGFNPDFIRRELDMRRQVTRLGLPVPALKEVAPDRSWFSESHINGTPLNRLSDPQAATAAAIAAANGLRRLLRQTQRDENLDDYMAGLYNQIQTLVIRSHLLTEVQKQVVMASTDTLVKRIETLRSIVGDRVTTALTHGDFQPGNILIDEKGVWLIDWEYAARRQIGYDALVFRLRSRLAKGLAARLHQFIARGSTKTMLPDSLAWPGVDWHKMNCRSLSGALFWLEELVLHLKENDNPLFVRPGPGLLAVVAELAAF